MTQAGSPCHQPQRPGQPAQWDDALWGVSRSGRGQDMSAWASSLRAYSHRAAGSPARVMGPGEQKGKPATCPVFPLPWGH